MKERKGKVKEYRKHGSELKAGKFQNILI